MQYSAFQTTVDVILYNARLAANKMCVAGRIVTVYVVFRGCCALIALAHHHSFFVWQIGHGETAVEYIKFTKKIIVFKFLHVGDDAAIELIHIFKALFL